jgi:hypothetical protein
MCCALARQFGDFFARLEVPLGEVGSSGNADISRSESEMMNITNSGAEKRG